MINFNQKCEPKDMIIHGAGQSPEAFKKYSDTLGENRPLLYMFYLRINEITKKLDSKINEMNGIDKNLIPQIALNFKAKGEGSKVKEILAGEFDSELDYLIKNIKSLNSPVFFRPGYEFNKPGKYNLEEFKKVWIYIYDFFKKNNVDNVAFIWCACTAFSKDVKQIMDYYPGDEYLDWFGNDLFAYKHFKNNKDKVTEDFAKQSESHHKPLMICESSAARTGVLKGEDSWNEWFVPYFNWIKSHSVVKAFCYINWHWGIDWKQPEWGDCRIEVNEYIKKNYIKEMSNKIFLHKKDSNRLN